MPKDLITEICPFVVGISYKSSPQQTAFLMAPIISLVGCLLKEPQGTKSTVSCRNKICKLMRRSRKGDMETWALSGK